VSRSHLIGARGAMRKAPLVDNRLHRATLCEDDGCAPEGFCLSHPTGELPEVLAAMGKPSRVYRDDPEHIWPLGWHMLLQAFGVVFASGVLVLSVFEAWKAFPK
jgi:hypothetical protein